MVKVVNDSEKREKNEKKFQKHFKNCLSSKVIWGQKKREKSFQTVVLVEFYSLLLRFLFSFFFYKPNLDFISFLFSEKFGLFCSFLFAIRFYVDSFTVCLLPFHFAEHSYAWFLFFFISSSSSTSKNQQSFVVAKREWRE